MVKLVQVIFILFYFSLVVAEENTNKQNSNFVVKLVGASGMEMQLHVREKPLALVLDEISNKTAVPIHYSVLPTDVVSATCVGDGLEFVLRCLLGDTVNMVFRYPASSLKGSTADHRVLPEEVWFIASSLVVKPSNKQNCQPQDNKALMTSVNGIGENNPQESLQYLLENARLADSSKRAQAIAKLARNTALDNEEVNDLIQSALDDESAKVRMQALSAWVLRSNDDITSEKMLEQALQDESRGVRLKAVNMAKTQMVLQQAVDDSDPLVRRYAERKLKRLIEKVK